MTNKDFDRRYAAYMQSPKWLRMKRLLVEVRGNKCERCWDCGESLDMHHMTYARVFKEVPSDLALLCRACHEVEDTSRAMRGRMLRLGFLSRFGEQRLITRIRSKWIFGLYAC
jgi:hypothetical protein